MYDANNVAKYIINYCMEKNSPITNLKLQKLLYFLWIAFYKERKEPLFSNAIYAWPLGPVVSDVYDEFCAYGGLVIRKSYNIDAIEERDTAILDNALLGLIPYSAHQLVDMTHAKGKPWDKIFANGAGRGCRIPFDLIIEDECS